MIQTRLNQLRLARGLSLDALAAEMGGVVTKQSLHKYEQGRAQPSARVLTQLAAALGVKSADLWGEPGCRVELIAYRKGSRLPKREQASVECLVRQTVEDRVRLQQLLQPANGPDLPIQSLPVKRVEDAEAAADTMRSRWNLGGDPIASMVEVLENHFVHVIEINAPEKFDGLAAVAYEDNKRPLAAAVVTRKRIAGERQRLNLGHELGHVTLKIPAKVDEEKAAFRFGGAFLAPAESLRRDVGDHRTNIQAEELLLLKRKYGMSAQALLYRLRDLEIISESHYKQWCIHINQLGWRRREPLEMPPERPAWLRRNLVRALAEGMISQEQAEQALGEQLETKKPLGLVQRRAFMKLPLAERRQVLSEQADQLAAHYEQDQSWKELETGDLAEHTKTHAETR